MSTRLRSEAKLSGWSREVLRSREVRSPEFTAKSRWAPLSRVGIRNTAGTNCRSAVRAAGQAYVAMVLLGQLEPSAFLHRRYCPKVPRKLDYCVA
ncbi:hypothetical protein HaLaN_04513 [Haematococcus lacustris]|uniref:Uncharacterized protein n=1 Tax=Haematococcus lacustris TaxID=44745 RepID=A0A699YST9_HAELA|nr:hypothetical protein HaLaN_04513 [Haematococcus lacustris]